MESVALELREAVRDVRSLLPLEDTEDGEDIEHLSSGKDFFSSFDKSDQLECGGRERREHYGGRRSSSYERRRVARRIDRILETLENLIFQSEDENENKNNDEEVYSLAAGLTEDLISVITEVCYVLLPSEEGKCNEGGIVQLYESSFRASCRILLMNSPVLPLSFSDHHHAKALLNRVAEIFNNNTHMTERGKRRGGITPSAANLGPILSVINSILLQIQNESSTSNVDHLMLPSLSCMETLNLTKILLKESFSHLEKRWKAPKKKHAHHSSWTSKVAWDEEDEEIEDEDDPQESGVQLRVLLGFILRHLASHMREEISIAADSQSQSGCSSTESTLSSQTNKVFKASPLQQFAQMHRNEDCVISEAEIEYFSCQLSNYLVETVEFALDVLDGASSQMRAFSARESKKNSISEEENENETSLLVVRDVVRHCCLAVDAVDIAGRKILGFGGGRSSSNDSREGDLRSLLFTYSDFVVSPISHKILKSSEDLRIAADELLQKMFKLAQELSPPRPNGKGKKRNNDQWDDARAITMLRMIDARSLLDSDEIAVLINGVNQNSTSQPHKIQKLDNSSDTKYCEVSSGHNVTSILQACVMSSLVLPTGTRAEHQQHQSHEQGPDTTPERNESGARHNTIRQVSGLAQSLFQSLPTQQNTAIVDPLNPWHSLISRKISDSIIAPGDDGICTRQGDVLGKFVKSVQVCHPTSGEEHSLAN